MLTTLDVPYVDTSAGELVWTLDHPLVPALATRTVSLPGAEVELRVLGASHQVVVRHDGGELIETVACLPGVRPHLPGTAVRDVRGRSYAFESRVIEAAPGELHERVARLRRMRSRYVLTAAFPGAPDAVTALQAARGVPVGWRTWHVYPGSAQIVETSTEVR